MAANADLRGDIRAKWLHAARGALLASLGMFLASPAAAYIGDSFISIPDSAGHWKGKEYRGWIRAEASEWWGRLRKLNSGSADPLAGDKLFFGGPNAAKPGNSGKLIVTLSKTNPDLASLMARCKTKAEIPVLTYAESSDLARPPLESGARPAELPAYWEYRLKKVVIEGCPVVEGATGQAFVFAFKDIEWLNYDPARPNANKIIVRPEDLPKVEPAVAAANKKVKSYLVTWIAAATTTTDEQCPKMNAKPTEADIFRYMTPEQVAALKAKNGEKGVTAGGDSERRGPDRLSVVALPFIVPDTGVFEPQSNVAMGIDLDGNDGSGSPPRGIRKHKNFVSPDGRAGIDNQLFNVVGCVAGFRGKRGYSNQTPNARRADGNIVTIIQVSDIDDEQNDNRVDISFIHSMDKPIRDNAGQKFIANYSFRPTDEPNHALYNARFSGRIKNGVIMSDLIPLFTYNPGQGGLTEFHDARMRFDPLPDGSVKGLIAGYVDWRIAAGYFASGYSEGLFGYNGPAMFYALRRNADGMKDPVTGEYNGISTVYEIDTVPAFITAAAPDAKRMAGDGKEKSKSR